MCFALGRHETIRTLEHRAFCAFGASAVFSFGLTYQQDNKYHKYVGKRTSGKRGFSSGARRDQLDGSGRPRRVLWTYCPHHLGGYYFYDIRIHSWNQNEAPKWEGEPDMRKVRGLCMKCTHTSVFFVGKNELVEHHYTNALLCLCGLPAYHQNPSREFLAQYNARPVPCRPNLNGQSTHV